MHLYVQTANVRAIFRITIDQDAEILHVLVFEHDEDAATFALAAMHADGRVALAGIARHFW